jgi:hypothetical protein
MKTLNTKLALLAFTFFTIATNISCSKNDDPMVTPLPVVLAPLQDPLQGYLAASGFDQVTTNRTNQGNTETGYSFIPSVNGKITAIVVKIPDTNPTVRVTIWDKTTSSVISTEILNINSANTEIIKPIIPINLIKDKEYVISMNTDDYYLRKKNDNSNVTYPFIVEDIKITSCRGGGGAAQIIPTIEPVDRFLGDCSFKFQK